MSADAMFLLHLDERLTNEEFAALEAEFNSWLVQADLRGSLSRNAPWGNLVEPMRVYAGAAYCFPGGTKNHWWPQVRAVGDWLVQNFDGPVTYGSDCGEEERYKPWAEAREEIEASLIEPARDS